MRRLNLNAKFSGLEVKDEYLLGRHYTVFPVVMLREGVHRGTSGVADYFNSLSINESVNTWSGRPITVEHPNDSCGKPFVLEEHWIGSIFEPSYDDKSKSLVAEAWIDKDRGAEVISALADGLQLDVSVGIWGDFSEEKGKWNEEEYESAVKKIVGDHLAILPDKAGACSWDDGCGIRPHQITLGEYLDKDYLKIEVIKRAARTPSFVGVEEIPMNEVDWTVAAYIKAYYKGNVPEDILSERGTGLGAIHKLPTAAKRWIASKTLLGDERAETQGPLVRDAFPVVNPKTNKLNVNALLSALRASEPETKSSGKYCERSSFSLRSVATKVRGLIKRYFPKVWQRIERRLERMEPVVDVDEITTVSSEDNKEKDRKIDNMADVFECVSPELKDKLLESYDLGNKVRQNLIHNITAASSNFCKDWLSEQTLTTLQAIAELASKARLAKPDEETENESEICKQNSYALQTAVQSAFSDDNYIMAPKIVWRKDN